MEGEFDRRTSSLILVWIMLVPMLLGLFMIAVENVSGSIRYVGPDSTYGTLQEALDDANSGDIIVIAEGNFNGSFTSDRRDLLIRGNSTTNTTLLLSNSVPSILDGNGIRINRLTITNGSLILRGNNVRITDMRVNSANGSLVLENSTGSRLENVEIGNQVELGIHLKNCSTTFMENIEGRGIDGIGVFLDRSTVVDIKWFNLTISSSGTGLFSETSTGIILDKFDITSSGSSVVGAGFSNSSSLQLRNGTLEINGMGFNIYSSSKIEINNVSFTTKANGSVGTRADLTTNLRFFLNDIYVMKSSLGINLSNSGNITFENSSIFIKDNGCGLRGIFTTPVEIRNGTVTADGDGSCGIQLNNTDDLKMNNMKLNSDGEGAISLLIDSCLSVDLQECVFNSKGVGSYGLIQKGDTNDLFAYDLRFNTMGHDSLGASLDHVTDSMMLGNQFKVDGVRSIGLMAFGSNLTLAGNYYTTLDSDSTGAILSGDDITVSNDSAYVMGRSSTGIRIKDLTKLFITLTDIDCSGADSAGLMITGTAGTYDIADCKLKGDEDTGTLLDVDDTASILKVSNTTFTSFSPRTVFRARTLRTMMGSSSITGSGESLVLIDTPSSEISHCSIISSLPVRVFKGNSTIWESQLGSSSQSLEAFDGTFIHAIDTNLNGVLVDPTSLVKVSNTLFVKTIDRFDDPLEGVDLDFQSDGITLYGTTHFNSTDPRTNSDGMAGPILADNRIYSGSPIPVYLSNILMIYKQGTSPIDWEDQFMVNTSIPGTVTFTSPDIDLPSVVTGIQVTPLDTREDLRLSWIPNEDDTLTYRVFKLDMEDLSTWKQVGEVDHPMATWTSNGMGPRERGIFRVSSWDGTWESKPSNIATAETKDFTPPDAPSGLNVVSVDQTSITISWDHPGSDDLSRFDIFLNKTGSTDMIIAGSAGKDNRTYSLTELKWGTTYRIQVQAVDSYGNPSPRSPVFEVTTALVQVSISVEAIYSDGGPLADLPVFNGSVSLVSFNGTVVATGVTDSMGTITFTGLTLDEFYTVHISPPLDRMGELNEKSGYLPFKSETFQLTEDTPDRTVNITLQYHLLPQTGSVQIYVIYGEGPRDGPAYEAYVVLLKESGEVVTAGQTDADGEMTFSIPRLPFRGRFEVTPAQGIAGDIETNRSGYLSQVSNFFEVTPGNPDFGQFVVALLYFDYTPPPQELMIALHLPKGDNVALDDDIRIRFSMPVNTTSVEANVKVVPALSGLEYIWDTSKRNLTIKHDSFLPEKNYTVTVQFGAMSLEGTTFPEDYTANTWSFRTEKEDTGGGGNEISEQVLIIIIIGVIVIIAIIGFYLWSTRRRNDDEMDEEDVYALSDEEYYDDEEDEFYDEDEEFLDEEFEDLPEDPDAVEYDEDEEFMEGEEMPLEGEVSEEDIIEEEPSEEDIIEEEEGPIDEEEDLPEDDEEMVEEEAPLERPKKKKRKKKRR